MKNSTQIYVALFRGINVGGNNLIDMKKLKIAFEQLGYTRVKTYINSGNVIFETEKSNSTLSSNIEKMVKAEFDLDLKILVKSYPQIESIATELPEGWVKDNSMRTDVMFLWEEFDHPDVLKQLKINLVDKIHYTAGALLWNIKDQDYSQSAMPKMIGSQLYKNMTIRNVNTFRKIYQMMRDLIQ